MVIVMFLLKSCVYVNLCKIIKLKVYTVYYTHRQKVKVNNVKRYIQITWS